MSGIKLKLDLLRAAGSILYAVGVIAVILVLLPGSEISGSVFWIIYGTVAVGLGSILKHVDALIKD